ncbi:MAG: hypothetical protein EAZ77_08630 [Nostocales cyanobacterium]|nr:MAG: hypothetical protein EAZ77_08630 [Nostocales cyanobacterium]
MTTLFDLDQYDSPPNRPIDPYWDEIILDSSSGKVEENGQATLFYDSSEEPPDPDDFATRADYLRAWIKWEETFPEQVTPRIDSIWQREYNGCKARFCIKEHSDNGYLIDFSVDIRRGKKEFRYWLGDTYPSPTHAELLFVEYANGDRNFPELDSGVLEELTAKPVLFDFEEGGIYWHEGRQLKAKIIKIYKSAKKADICYAGDIFQERIYLSDLSPLPEKKPCVSETVVQQEPEPVSSENCAVVASLPEQADSVLEKAINQWVESYYVKRGEVKFWYYRYCYYQKRIKHIHIPGGGITSPKSQQMKEKVEIAIAQNISPSQIEALIKQAT